MVRTHKGGGDELIQMLTIAYKGEWGGGGFKVAYVRKKKFLDQKISIFFFFCTKEALPLLHCHLLLCINKCKPALSYK